MGKALSENDIPSPSSVEVPQWRKAVPYLRFCGTTAMLYVLITKVHWSSLAQIGKRGFGLIGVAFLATLLAIYLSGIRWQRVLDVLGVQSRMRDLVELQLAGMFAGNFLPSTVGGDIVRATWLAKVNKEKSDSIASVVLERLTGWLVLPILVLLGTFTDPSILHLGEISKVIVLVAAATLVGFVVLLTVVRSSQLFELASRSRLMAGLLESVSGGVGKLARQPRSLARLLGWALIYQLCVIVASIFAASALQISIGWRVLLVFVPTVAMLQVVPLTIGGLGVREGALVLMLHPLGIGSAQAIAFGLLVYALNVAASLLGAPSFALGSKRMLERTGDSSANHQPLC